MTTTAPMSASMSKVDRLVVKSTTAAQVRAYRTHPDVAALRIEQVRAWSGALIWVGVVLGLAFTATNVQAFAAGSAAAGSMAWLAAWLLDPMVSLVLVGVLLAEQVTSRFQLATPVWARRTKWFALLATYVMNTWQSWATLTPAGLVLHSVPPLLVFTAVEGGPALRDRLTDAVNLAATTATHTPPAATSPAVNPPLTTPVDPPVNTPVNNPVGAPTGAAPAAAGVAGQPAVTTRARTRATGRKPGARTPAAGKAGGRRLLKADYLAAARAAWTPDTHVTPAWVRQVTDCSRGLSSQVAADLKTELDTATTSTDSVPAVVHSVPAVAAEGEAA
jgi:hypothetical protein